MRGYGGLELEDINATILVLIKLITTANNNCESIKLAKREIKLSGGLKKEKNKAEVEFESERRVSDAMEVKNEITPLLCTYERTLYLLI